MLRAGVSDVLDNTNTKNPNIDTPSSINEASRFEKILTFEWLGQTFASAFWIVSVFTSVSYTHLTLPTIRMV